MAFAHIDCFSGPGRICTGMHAAGNTSRSFYDERQLLFREGIR